MSEKLRFEDDDNRGKEPIKKSKKRKYATSTDKAEESSDGGSTNKEHSDTTDDTADSSPAEDTPDDTTTDTDDGAEHTPPPKTDGKAGTQSDSKLKFSKEERKINNLEGNAEKYSEKLSEAREKLPTRKVRKKERVLDKKTGKEKTKLSFEKENIPISEAKWNNPKPKTFKEKAKHIGKKTTNTVHTAAVHKLHTKIYQVENENVGTQATHRAELVGESAYRGTKRGIESIYRFARNTPYRKVATLETKSIKNQVKLSYQKTLRDNPNLKSNPVSRFYQKRSIKKQYATALRNAKKGAKTAKRTGGIIHKTSQVITGLVRRNPVLLLKAGLLLLIIFFIMSMFSMCSTLFSGGSAVIGATSYAAEDADIDMAELSYTEWETDLQIEIQNAETSHSGYDEYRYNIGDIGHNPFELMGFLTAGYNDFTYSEIQSVLQGIFAEQYQLAFESEVEIRTRTETRTGSYTDSEGNTQSYTYEVEVEYEWHILNVILTSDSFSEVIYPRMNADQQEHFNLLMRSKGNRQYVANPFDMNWLPYLTSYYGYRIHPISGEKNYHKGVDIGLPTGTEIRAGFDGTITTASYDSSYGNYVVIECVKEVTRFAVGGGSVTETVTLEAKYAHCDTLLVYAGQAVKEGDIIATVGNTGNSTGSHLHLEVVKDGLYLNPIYYAISGDDGSGSIPPGNPGGVAIPDYSGEPMGDGSYAALLAEAERWIGMPYVFGGSSPSTSFDCSGYLCWIINQSGSGSVGRTTAQGLYNLCTPVSVANAKPGDLLFFHSYEQQDVMNSNHRNTSDSPIHNVKTAHNL